MSAIATTALVEEAEKLSQRATPGPWRVGTVHAAEEVWAAYPDGLAGLASERLLLRLNPNFTSEQDTAFIARARTLVPEFAAALRRAEAELDAATTQLAKKFKRLEELEKRAEKAEAERDAQHALVLRLTAERDEEKSNALQMLADSGRRAIASARLAADLDESRAQVWGLICAGSNMAERKRYFQGLWETLRDAGLKGDAQLSELTATRDLLTAENARLQARVATLELLRRGGK